jgi:hypothetical protein
MELVAVYRNCGTIYMEHRPDRPDLACSTAFSLVQNAAAKLLVEFLCNFVSKKLCCEEFSCS